MAVVWTLFKHNEGMTSKELIGVYSSKKNAEEIKSTMLSTDRLGLLIQELIVDEEKMLAFQGLINKKLILGDSLFPRKPLQQLNILI